VEEPTARSTLPKVDKANTSSAEVPTTWALVVRLKSKAPDDNLADGGSDLLDFTAVES
jgi:hypothetical protein